MLTNKSNDSCNVNPTKSSFFGINHNISYWGFSQRGESHKQNGSPCQDSCLARPVKNTPFLIVAMADGLGSCALSHYGAEYSAQFAAEYLENLLTQFHGPMEDKYMGELLRAAMQHAYEKVKNLAEDMKQLEYSFQSTLTLTVYDGNTLYISHVGDGGILVLTEDGLLELVTARLKGEEASSVYPLQAGPNFWQVFKIDRRVNAFIMATDGVLDAFVGDSREANRIYYPFIEPALTQVGSDTASVHKIQQFYYQYMEGEEYRRVVTDDLTLIAVTNLSRLSENKLPDFDKDEWDRNTMEYQKELDATLYAGRIKDSSEPDQKNIHKKRERLEKEIQQASSPAPTNQIKIPEFVNNRHNIAPETRSENGVPFTDTPIPQLDIETNPTHPRLHCLREKCREFILLLFIKNIFLISCLVILIILILLLKCSRPQVPIITIMPFLYY